MKVFKKLWHEYVSSRGTIVDSCTEAAEELGSCSLGGFSRAGMLACIAAWGSVAISSTVFQSYLKHRLGSSVHACVLLPARCYIATLDATLCVHCFS